MQPAVSVLDPASGQARTQHVPAFDDPASKPQWRALFDDIRRRMEARGLEETMMIGMLSDGKPSREEIAFWREVTGDLPWVSHSHFPTHDPHYFGKILGTGFQTGYMTSVYRLQFPADPAEGRTYGWRNPVLHAQYMRPAGGLDRRPGAFLRGLVEINIAGGQHGFGRMGGDYWRSVRDQRGRIRGYAYERFPQSTWGNLNLRSAVLAPGPDGPVATTRLEVMREGIQECEARIFLETALTDEALRERLGSDLIRRSQALLDERTLAVQRGLADFEVNCYGFRTPWNWIFQTGVAGHAWFAGSDWQKRSRMLYKLAAEVAHRLEQP